MFVIGVHKKGEREIGTKKVYEEIITKRNSEFYENNKPTDTISTNSKHKKHEEKYTKDNCNQIVENQ